MTIEKAKEILLAANLSSLEKLAMYVLFEAIDFSDLPGEIWRDVVDYEGLYQVSNYGRVKSLQRGKVRILKAAADDNGYLRVVLSKNGETKNRFVHVLVARAFLPNPNNLPQVDHIDTNKFNNHLSNLRWATSAENIRYAFEKGLRKTGCEHFRAKFTAEQVREIRRDCVPCDREKGFKVFAEKFNVSHNVIRDAYYRKTYRDVE